MTKEPARRFNGSKILAEGLLIILSILIAFGIDAAWDNRQENIKNEEALISLRNELKESLPLLEETMGRIQFDLKRMRGLFYNPEEEVNSYPSDSLSHYVEALFRPNTSDDNALAIKDALNNLGSSSQRDTLFQSAVITWRQIQIEILERGEQLADHESDVLENLAQNRELAKVLIEINDTGWGVHPSPGALLNWAKSPEAQVILGRRVLQAQVLHFWTDLLRDSAENLIGEIDRLLAKDS